MTGKGNALCEGILFFTILSSNIRCLQLFYLHCKDDPFHPLPPLIFLRLETHMIHRYFWEVFEVPDLKFEWEEVKRNGRKKIFTFENWRTVNSQVYLYWNFGNWNDVYRQLIILRIFNKMQTINSVSIKLEGFLNQ